MKKVWILLLALLLMLAVPVSAAGQLVYDGENLLTDSEIQALEAKYAECAQLYGFSPILVTTDSFEGMTAAEYAGHFYDTHGFPQDGMLFLVSFTEGEWYLLTNGVCYETISDSTAQGIGEDMVEILHAGDYYGAFAQFPELAGIYFEDLDFMGYLLIIAGCIGVGCVVGLIVAGIMALMMKSVGSKYNAADYVRPGSMRLSTQRDIFLYSHVTRRAKPKNNPSSGGGGGSRGGAGGKL